MEYLLRCVLKNPNHFGSEETVELVSSINQTVDIKLGIFFICGCYFLKGESYVFQLILKKTPALVEETN